MTTAALRQARSLAAAGRDEAARQAYLAILGQDPDQVAALVELGVLAEAGGYRSAARSAYQRAVVLDPDHAIARTGLANALRDAGKLAAARDHYRAALRSDPSCAAAHQGLAGVLSALGDPSAEAHWHAGYAGQTATARRYRGSGPATELLLLFAAKGGNIDTQPWIDDRRYAVTALCADYHDTEAPLPPHHLVVNAIGDADLYVDPLGPNALANAERIIARGTAPVINGPALVRRTTRTGNALRLAAIPGVVTPRTAAIPRRSIAALRDWDFPLLLRSPGFHTGQHCRCVDSSDALAAAAAALPGEVLLAIAYHDYSGADGLFRKYRVMFIDGAIYPLHMAASADWKVHYFTAAMTGSEALREEEAGFLNRMTDTLGAKAMAALEGIADTLALDYAGVDFALRPDGSILVFEANATMVAPLPGREPIWDYRRDAVAAVLAAAGAMVSRRVARKTPSLT